MKDLTTFYNHNITETSENSYLFFNLGDNKYAINTLQVVDIMKLPHLDYPQKLANNVIGLLNYNSFTINVLDLRFYLDIKVTPYSVSNQLLIVKTDESIFALVIDKAEDIILLDESKIEPFEVHGKEKVIEFIYKRANESISIINLNTLENIVKGGRLSNDVDIPSLFPTDENSVKKFKQRSIALQEKTGFDLMANVFSQDRFISFSLDENIYCINFEYIKEFLKDYSITKVPCNFDYIAGVIALRGEFVNIVDIKRFLGISESAAVINYNDSKNNIIVIETSDFKLGFLVDEIYEIINIAEDSVTKKSHSTPKYVQGEVIINEKLYTIFDMKYILSDERFFVEEG